MRRFFPLLAVLLCVWSCGYHFPGNGSSLPGQVRSLYIELFTNRTAEPFLENRITSSVIDRFARRSPGQVVDDRSGAEAILSGMVTEYRTESISYDSNDMITEYRSTMSISVTLRQTSDDHVLWKGNLAWSEEYPASRDKAVQEDNEAAAIDVIAERLAQELYSRITENF